MLLRLLPWLLLWHGPRHAGTVLEGDPTLLVPYWRPRRQTQAMTDTGLFTVLPCT